MSVCADEMVVAAAPPAARALPQRRSRLPRIMRELTVVTLLLMAYRHARTLTRDDTGEAMSNAWRVVDVERRLGLYTEQAIQQFVLRSRVLVEFLNRYYVSVHFALTATFVIWVIVRHPEAYRRVKLWFIGVTGSALVLHVAFPLAPPRFLRSEGFVDTLRVYGPTVYSADLRRSVANQVAAMPSLHFGWAVLVAIGFVSIRRSRWALLAFVHPVVTLLAIVATANHYWADAIVAMALVLAVMSLTKRWIARHPVAIPERVARARFDRLSLQASDRAARRAVSRARSEFTRASSSRDSTSRWMYT